MRIRIVTPLDTDFATVVQHFDERLLAAVSPPFPPTRLLRYDGNRPGGEVHVELNFMFFRQVWKSVIVSHEENDERLVFTDEGTQLPFFLAAWHHQHRVERTATGCRIVDDLRFRSPSPLTDWLLYPLMYGQFWLRKPLYRRYFERRA
jgi:ligand-binding SRPBCC domain-containing protein